MLLLRCQATRLVEDDFPGWVEVQLMDAHDRVWTISDKLPIFGGPEIDPSTTLPVEVTVACRVVHGPLEVASPGTVVRISTDPDGVTADDGTDKFEVRWEQLVMGDGD